ncbi:putative 2-oxoglutarate-dependent dioxygenase AOP1.2 [Morella rubra]|uniref:Putative 2-oxoglutarate-dependent dioxygenase AOP1.2 n=1 Tax=Morella rubra TaxID=262757 RepID=A0A6A1WP62_9ROSI|nr:putative 2-oxoglutarate-dependent dioxygenase AOP1.2 [Morella rubra]
MPSRKQGKIPVIDFCAANLKPGTDYWVSACDNVRQALEEYGCFEALYDEVSLELHNAVFDSLVELFTLPVQTKALNISDKPYHGYFGQNPFMPLNESMGIEDPQILNRTQAFTNLMWPSGNESFCESICSYSRIVSQLDGLVKAMAFESYGVRKYLDSHINSTAYLLRVIKYSVPKERESDIGAVSHTDKSFISILHQNDVKGLEIKTRDDKWIGFEPLPSSFVVMAGEAFTAWSNGRIYSPQHKVIMRGDKARYSLALFSFNNGTIQTPEELFDDEHPLQFKPFDHLEFLRFYSTDEGQKYPSTINAYCGISL